FTWSSRCPRSPASAWSCATSSASACTAGAPWASACPRWSRWVTSRRWRTWSTNCGGAATPGRNGAAPARAGAGPGATKVAGVPVFGGVAVAEVAEAVRRSGADTVAVLSCPEIDGATLRQLAWELEKTGADLCVAPALLDVAGPRTTVRPTAGLTLLHVDHPQLSGPRQVLKSLFDRVMAALAIILISPIMAAVAIAIRAHDHGPALFKQDRVGKDGELFRVYKFRTMVVDAE